MLCIFLNTDFVGTEPKDAAYPVTGLNSKHNAYTSMFNAIALNAVQFSNVLSQRH
jgi:hypothetical protein